MSPGGLDGVQHTRAHTQNVTGGRGAGRMGLCYSNLTASNHAAQSQAGRALGCGRLQSHGPCRTRMIPYTLQQHVQAHT